MYYKLELTMYYRLELTMYYYCFWYDKLWGPSQRVVTLFKSDNVDRQSQNRQSQNGSMNLSFRQLLGAKQLAFLRPLIVEIKTKFVFN